jgi:radical SAM superfamily enzyme YgiQ (UPF0313 family)
VASISVSLHAFPPYSSDTPMPAIGYLKGFLESHAPHVAVHGYYWNQTIWRYLDDEMKGSFLPAADPNSGLRRWFIQAVFGRLYWRWAAEKPSSNGGAAYVDALGALCLSENSIDRFYEVTESLGTWLDRRFDEERLETHQIIGCSNLYSQTIAGAAFLKRMKTRNPGILTVIGGVGPDEGACLLRAFEFIDIAVFGEGEQTLLDLSDRLTKGEDWTGIPGIVRRQGDRIESNMPRTPAEDVDNVVAAYDGFQWVGSSHSLPIWDSRSCKWRRCTFCDDSRLVAGYRARSVDSILSEIRGHLERHEALSAVGAETDVCLLGDEVGGFSKKRLIKLADGLAEIAVDSPSDVSFSMALSPSYMSEEVFSHLNQIDVSVEFGFEQWNRFVRGVRKPHSIEQGIYALKLAERFPRVRIMGLNILHGFPGETLQDLLETQCTLNKLRFILQKLAYDYGKNSGTLGMSPGSELGRQWDWDNPTNRERLKNRPEMMILSAIGVSEESAMDLGSWDTRLNSVSDVTGTVAQGRLFMDAFWKKSDKCHLEAFRDHRDKLVLRETLQGVETCSLEFDREEPHIEVLHLTREPTTSSKLEQAVGGRFSADEINDAMEDLRREDLMYVNPESSKCINTLPEAVQMKVDDYVADRNAESRGRDT